MKQPKMKLLHPSFDPHENWRTPEQKKYLYSKEWKEHRQQILNRDNFTCVYCGFKADKYMMVDHIDGVPGNNSDKNLQTVCIWCHMIKHIGMFSQIEKVIDLYIPPSGFTQVSIIQNTRILRGQGLTDKEILTELELKRKMPFKMDYDYLKKLVGFITSRPGMNNNTIYGNINIKGPSGIFLPVESQKRRQISRKDAQMYSNFRKRPRVNNLMDKINENPFYDNKHPSKEKSIYWILAERIEGDYPEPTKNSGKWLVFVDIKELDTMWAKIKKATEEGKLGASAKTATSKPNSNASDPNIKVICVYSYDWTDKDDVMRIREELRKIGITWKIPYKSDEDTIKGKYRVKGDVKISKYYE